MLKNIKARIFHRPRKYPIKYDEYGRSLRERAFELFDKAKKPDEVSAICDRGDHCHSPVQAAGGLKEHGK